MRPLTLVAFLAAASGVLAAPSQEHIEAGLLRRNANVAKHHHTSVHKKAHKPTPVVAQATPKRATTSKHSTSSAKPTSTKKTSSSAKATTKPIISGAGSTAAPAMGTSKNAAGTAALATASVTHVAQSAASAAATGAYFLNQSNRGSSFFSNGNWNFFAGEGDPTHGAVTYESQSSAQSLGLIGIANGQAFVSTSTKDLPVGSNRPSVRLFSKQTWNSGLIIFDVAKMPVGCATWPALWTYSDNDWPAHGEIDVMEGIGYTSAGTNENLVTVHLNQTSPIDTNSSLYSGSTLVSSDCNTNYGMGNTGCAFRDSNTMGPSWGPAFNSAGGGVWAMQFGKGDGIKVWFWGRSRVPSELSKGTAPSPGTLNPSTWGKPMANFQSEKLDMQVSNQQIVLDITIGGDWAGNVPMDGNCGSNYQTAFASGANYVDAKFVLNGIDVYCSGSPNGC